MSIKTDRAEELHQQKYNCAQAVACAFCEDFGIDHETAAKMAEAFGLGMGVMDMCGAISGMLMVIGMKHSAGDLSKGKVTKAETYQFAKEYIAKFEELVGSHVCKEIKGVETGTVLCSCGRCIEIATQLTEEFLENYDK